MMKERLENQKKYPNMNFIEFRPPYKEVIDIIHKAGGSK